MHRWEIQETEEIAMTYELYYWPSIQGRGETVRLALEESGAGYVDVARGDPENGHGVPALMRFLESEIAERPPYAPPFLKDGDLVIAQSSNILMYLGERHNIAPQDAAGRYWANQLQMTLADFLDEGHDAHHPLGGAFYYEDQQPEAKRRSAAFIELRIPKYMSYFEKILQRSGGNFLLGEIVTYPDLSLFQVVSGVRYAFPNAMAAIKDDYPCINRLCDSIAERPRISDYLASDRRIPFNESGIFRYYPELDL